MIEKVIIQTKEAERRCCEMSWIDAIELFFSNYDMEEVEDALFERIPD